MFLRICLISGSEDRDDNVSRSASRDRPRGAGETSGYESADR